MPENSDKEEEKPVVAKTAIDLQRLKLQKLMKNPEKPIILPERPKSKSTPSVPEFVRNVMGSSAGAGSGEFHVYRHLRRKEYARQKFIQEKGHKELLDIEYHEKLEENKRLAEEVTAKKRAKRLKKKQKWKQKKRMKPANSKEQNKNDYSDSEEDSEKDDNEPENLVNEKNENTNVKDNDTKSASILNSEQNVAENNENQNNSNTEEDNTENSNKSIVNNINNNDS